MTTATDLVLARTVTGGDGRARFEEERLTLEAEEHGLALGPVLAARGLGFRVTPADFDRDQRAARSRRLVLVTDGTLEVIAGTGESRRFRAGDLLEVADTTGEGHRSRAFGGPFRSVVVSLDPGETDRTARPRRDDSSGVDILHAAGERFVPERLPYSYRRPDDIVTPQIGIDRLRFARLEGRPAEIRVGTPSRTWMCVALDGTIEVALDDDRPRLVGRGEPVVAEPERLLLTATTPTVILFARLVAPWQHRR